MAQKSYIVRDTKTGEIIRETKLGTKINEVQLQERAQTVKKNISSSQITQEQAKQQIGKAETLQEQQQIKINEQQQQQAQEVLNKINENPNRKDITNQSLREKGFNMQQISEFAKIQERKQRQLAFEEAQSKKGLSFEKYKQAINNKYMGKERETSENNTNQEAQRLELKTNLYNIEKNKNLNYLQKEEAKRDLTGANKNKGLFIQDNTPKDYKFINEILTTKEQRILQKAVRKESMTKEELNELKLLSVNKNKELNKLQTKQILNIPKDILRGSYEVGYEIGNLSGKVIKSAYNYGYNTSTKAKKENKGVLSYFAKDLTKVITTPVKSAYNYGYNTSKIANKNKKSVVEYFLKDGKAGAVLVGMYAKEIGKDFTLELKKNPTKTVTKAVLYMFPETLFNKGKIAFNTIKTSNEFKKSQEIVLKSTNQLRTKALEIAKKTQFSTNIVSKWSKNELTKFLNKFSNFETRTVKGKTIIIEKVKGKPLTKQELKEAQRIFNKKEVPKEKSTSLVKKETIKEQKPFKQTQIKEKKQKQYLLEFKPKPDKYIKIPKNKEFFTKEQLENQILLAIDFKKYGDIKILKQIARKKGLSFKIIMKKGKNKVLFKENINLKAGIKTKREYKKNIVIENNKVIKIEKIKPFKEENKILSPKEERRLKKELEFKEGQNLDKIQNDLRNMEKKGLFTNKKGQLIFNKSFKKQTQKLKNQSQKQIKKIRENRKQVNNYQFKIKNLKEKYNKSNNRQKPLIRREIKQTNRKILEIKQKIKQDNINLIKQQNLIKTLTILSTKIKLKQSNLNINKQDIKQQNLKLNKQQQQLKQQNKNLNKLNIKLKPFKISNIKIKKTQIKTTINKKQTQKLKEKSRDFKQKLKPKLKEKIKIEKLKPKIKLNIKLKPKKHNKLKYVSKGLIQYKDTKTKKLKQIKLNLPYNKTRKLALKGVDNTLLGSVRVKKYGKTKQKDIKPFSNKKFILNKKNQEVEKRKYRLDTKGEKKGLQFAKFIKSQVKKPIKRVSKVVKPIKSKKVFYKPVKRVIIIKRRKK